LAGSPVAAREPWVVVRNTVFTDFKSSEVMIVKNVFGEDIAVKDDQSGILWKFTNEVRDIAGYECRRANGLIGDSVYVVAFYSVEIIPKGGPESFSGLPGMILGVALPHENVTWFATRLELGEAGPIKAPVVPNRIKQMDRGELEIYLRENVKDWGDLGLEALKAFLL
jgi:GLPGLI family protein